MHKLKVIDLFAGCGGLTDGFEKTKLYETVACVEWDTQACKTLINRLKKKWGYKNSSELVIQHDIQKTAELLYTNNRNSEYNHKKSLKELVNNKGNLDIVIGGPPCQAYSVAGRIRDENGMNDDYRNYLFESYLEIVKYFKPKVFVFENVPGLLSAKPGGISIVSRITDAFKEIGFIITDNLRKNALIDCSRFGVPQTRKRLIILGINQLYIKADIQVALDDFYNLILPKYEENNLVTVKDAINDLPGLFPLNEIKTIGNKKFSHMPVKNGFTSHIPRMHNERDIKTFRLLTSDIENKQYKYTTTESLKNLYTELTGKKSNIHKYHVLKWDKPSNTIPAHLYKDGLRHIHPDPKQARSITVREAARLQSFDDDFEFLGSMTDQFKMIGNAVPPKFAFKVALATNDFLNKYIS